MADEKPPAPKPRLPWPIAAVVVVLAVAVAVILVLGRDRRPSGQVWDRPLEPVAQIEAVEGTVRAGRGDQRRALATGETIYVGEGVEAESGASLSMITYPAEARLTMRAGARLSFEAPAEIRVDEGTVQAAVGTAVAQFTSPHGRITALETQLSVEVSPRGTQLEVQKGDALVEAPHMKQRVRAGARFFVGARPASAAEPHP